jgi:hypothetical protein
MPDRAGFVYIFGGEGIYKIGRAKDPAKRVSTLTKLPFRAELIHTIQSDDAVLLETHLHHRFKEQRVNGEWFRLTDKDLTALKRTKRLLVRQLIAPRPAKLRPAAPPRLPAPPVAPPTTPGMHVRLAFYLSDLKQQQAARPGDQRVVPTVADLAVAAGVSTQAIYNILNSNINGMRFETFGAIIREFRRRGFEAQVEDILGYNDYPD